MTSRATGRRTVGPSRRWTETPRWRGPGASTPTGLNTLSGNFLLLLSIKRYNLFSRYAYLLKMHTYLYTYLLKKTTLSTHFLLVLLMKQYNLFSRYCKMIGLIKVQGKIQGLFHPNWTEYALREFSIASFNETIQPFLRYFLLLLSMKRYNLFTRYTIHTY